jgi:hypothetical protein
MSDPTDHPPEATARPLPRAPDCRGIEVVRQTPETPLADHRAAMAPVDRIAEGRLGDRMLLSWYDRDFETPQHVSECRADSATPGYVDYGTHHAARLKVDLEGGRFVFFYLPPGGR